jgi:hypothetical protein
MISIPKHQLLVSTLLGVLMTFGLCERCVHAGQATIRPIEDFVAQQGTFCIPDGGGGCVLFVPPVENFFGLSDPASNIAASVDYAGLADDWIQSASGGAVSFGTEFAGNVLERPLSDGRAEIKVNLHTTNALTWVVDGGDFANGDLLFGHRAPDVLAGAAPALGEILFQVTFINSAPGDPLSDLLQLAIAPEPGQEFLSVLGATVHAKGTLRDSFGVPDGTPGKVTIAERALLTNPGQGSFAEDGFPVERINLRTTGPSSASITAIPEPSTLLLVGIGLLTPRLRRRRRWA